MSGNHGNLRRIKEIVSPERLWNPLLLRTLQLVAVPALILLAAALAVAASHALPRSLSGLIGVGPYIVLLLGTAISAWFNRSRALIMLASLLAAYAGYSLASDLGRESFALRAVLTAFAVLVPFNVLLALAFPERGVRQYRNYRWVLLGLAEILVVIWIAYAGRSSLSGTAWRDALEERLTGLGPTYAIGMIDVDNFKQFNDAHGHHIGDQVLKLVAARLATIEGGGTSYRYGGEEFCVLFSDRTLEQALPHLERLRKDIEDYRMAVRGGDRPKERATGSRLRATRAPEKTLSVTVSIGAAERDDTLIRPALGIRAADEAL